MHLRFADAALARVCNSRSLLQRRWGQDRGAAVARGLLLLRGAPDLAAVRTIPTCRPGDGSAEWSVNLPQTIEILFVPQRHAVSVIPFPRTMNEDTWLLVTKIVEMVLGGADDRR